MELALPILFMPEFQSPLCCNKCACAPSILQFSLLIGPSFLAFAPSAFSSSQIHLSLSIHVAPGNQSGGGCTWTSCAVAGRGWRNNVSQRKERKWEERSVKLAGYDRRAGCVREGRGLGKEKKMTVNTRWHVCSTYNWKKQMKYLVKLHRSRLLCDDDYLEAVKSRPAVFNYCQGSWGKM